MIFDILIIVVSSVLYMLGKLLTIISYVLPEEIFTAVSWFISKIWYFSGVFNVSIMFQATIALVIFYTLLYTFYVIKFAYAHIPWLGKDARLPKIDHTIIHTSDGKRHSTKWIDRETY